MKKRFTKFLAALALLVFMTPSLAGWGQSTKTLQLSSTAKFGTTSPASLTQNSVTWTCTATGAGTIQNTYDNKTYKGQQFGTGSAKWEGTFSTSGITGTITNIEIGANSGGTAKASVKVGNTDFTTGSNNATQATFYKNTSNYTTATFTGNASGDIVVTTWDAGNSTKAFYLNHITVTYTSGPVTYSVTYNANEGTGDDLVDGGYASGTLVTVKANEGTGNPNFTKTGYEFNKWNTKADGTGTEYTAGSTFNISSNTNLYAQWTKKNYNVAVSSIEDVTLTATYGVNTIAEDNNADVPYGTAITLAAADLGVGQAFVWSIIKQADDTDVTSEVLSGTTLTVPDYAVTIGGTIATTYTVTYDCNGGTSGCPENATGIASGSSITLAAAPTKTGSVFMGWNDGSNTYDAGALYTVINTVTLTAQWAVGGLGEIKFGSASGSTAINSISVTGNDNLENTWTITTVLKSGSGTGFSQNSSYSQVGSGSRYATSLTMTMTLPTPTSGYAYQITNFEAKFGGFSGDAGDITLKVGESDVATGSLNGTTDVVVKNSSSAVGTVLTVTVTNTNLRCKVYYIKYSYAQIALTPVIITFNGNGGETENEETIYTQTVYDGVATSLTANQFTYGSSIFAGWSTTQNGEVVYADQAEVTLNADLTLYAQWETGYTAMVDSPIEGGSVYIVTATGNEEIIEAAEGTEITLTYTANLGYAFSAWNVYYTDENQQVVPVEVNNNKFNMPAYDVTISAGFEEVTTYSLVTNVNQIVSGKHYIIASSATNGSAYAMSNDKGNNRNQVAISVSNNTINGGVSGLYEFVINGSANAYTLYDKNEQNLNENNTYGYLYAASNSSNHLKTTSNTNTAGDDGKWSITIGDGNAAVITAQGTNSHNIMRYNSGSSIFSCYASGQAAVYLYVKVNDKDLEYYGSEITYEGTSITEGTITVGAGSVMTVPAGFTNNDPANLIIADGGILITKSSGVNATVKKNVEGATNWGAGTSYDADGWYFIASPVNGAAFPTGTVANQDIFQLDWANNKWLNLQYSGNNALLSAGFQRGTGYLYASKDGNTLSVAGEIKPLTEADTAKVILKTTGWNLIGNPLTCKVKVDKAFSELNNASGVTSKDANSTINPCQGIAVYGNAGTTVTFTKAESQAAAAPSNSNSLQMTLAKKVTSRGDVSTKVVDNAVVSFKESKCMPKFNMIGGNTKLFIPQDDEEYAVVFSDRQGDVPLNFKADELGTYTINFETSGRTSLQGIYLIDMLEEQEIDLSVEPSYTFIGSPADRAARFKIVFRTGFENSPNDIFAYQNGNDIIVSGEGELQIFDVMGRMVSRQYVSGVEAINILTQGVYIMKLNDKTQKIVVR